MVRYTITKKSERTSRQIIILSTSTDSEVIVHLLEDQYQKTKGDLIEAIKRTVYQLDGIYILAIREQATGNIILVEMALE